MSDMAYINEFSLCGQYDDLDDFLYSNREFVYVIGWLSDRHYHLLKRDDLYSREISPNKQFVCLNGYRPSGGNGDVLRKMKVSMLSLYCSPPFWSAGENEVKCLCEGENLSGSSVARAAYEDAVLLSFAKSDRFSDKHLNVNIDCNDKEIFSITTSRLLAEDMYGRRMINGDEYLRLRYRNTRLDFSKLDSRYGTSDLQKGEFEDCIKSFDRFIGYDSWKGLLDDDSLNYKAYSPSSSKNDWFSTTKYNNKKIDKFRCINPKRCFGYREGDVFFALRIERDHSVSDHG